MTSDRAGRDAAPSGARPRRRRRAPAPATLLGALAAALLTAPLAAQDAGFLLTTDSPAYTAPGYVGNGRFSLLTTPTGLDPALSLLAGLYEHAPGDVARIAALPEWSAVDVHDGASWLSAAPADTAVLRSYRQEIDMRDGVVRTRYAWVDGERRMGVRVEGFVSRADPHLAVIDVQLEPTRAGPLRVRFPLRGREPPHRLRLAELEKLDPSWGNDRLWYPGYLAPAGQGAEAGVAGGEAWVTARPVAPDVEVAVAAAIAWPGDVPGLRARALHDSAGAAVEVTFRAAAGRRYRFRKYVAVVSSAESSRPLEAARADATEAREKGFAAARDASVAEWRRLWRTDVRIDGDPELQRVARSMLFYLRCSTGRDGWSVPPMGLSGGGYYGHVFWDADTWMFPALVVLDPELARSMVAFRARTLGAAEANARANGWRGAMYPWEADDLGHEATPRFAAQNASSEIHVTGDVALAQWQYYEATGDSAWLARVGYPVLAATAVFWTSRVSRDSAADRYHVRDVVSVDEGLVGVEDDAYTNAVAKRNLLAAVDAARRLGLAPDTLWARIAARLPIPYDSAGEFHPTYRGAPPATLGSVVPLLSYPLRVAMSESAKRRDLDHAVRRLEREGDGAMMTTTLYPVVAAELGDTALVDRLLRRSYRPWLRGPFDALAETPRSGPGSTSFLTGAGGFLQQILFGWTGLRLGDDGLEPAYPPLLPTGVRRLVLTHVRVRGQFRDVVVEAGKLRLSPQSTTSR